jgi:hypothetical protein
VDLYKNIVTMSNFCKLKIINLWAGRNSTGKGRGRGRGRGTGTGTGTVRTDPYSFTVLK